LDNLTSRQLSEWEAYDKIDPIGSWRDDFRIAKLESLLTNIVQQLYAKKGSAPTITTPLDFMPDWSGERADIKPEKSLADEIKQVFSGIASNKEKKVERKLKPPVTKTKWKGNSNHQ